MRDHFRLLLADQAVEHGQTVADSLKNVIPRIGFVNDGLLVGGRVYIEHGHRFDPVTHVLAEHSPAIGVRVAAVDDDGETRLLRELHVLDG